MNSFNFLTLPKSVKIEKISDNEGVFSFEPLIDGYAITIGNALRRVLLSSIPGISPIGIEIEGVSHEFSTIPGVKEDVLNIILNLKEIKFKALNENFEKDIVGLHKNGAGTVLAKDLELPFGLSVINPEFHIATLMDNASINAQIHVAFGVGYKQVDIELVNKNIGYLPIDASFSPVKRVFFRTEKSTLKDFYDFEKLILEIETDGTISPIKCVNEASHILTEYISLFSEVFQNGTVYVSQESKKSEINENLLKSIDELELNVRASNCLKSHNVEYIYQLIRKSDVDLLNTKNFGKQSLKEIKASLKQLNLELNTYISDEDLKKIKEKIGDNKRGEWIDET